MRLIHCAMVWAASSAALAQPCEPPAPVRVLATAGRTVSAEIPAGCGRLVVASGVDGALAVGEARLRGPLRGSLELCLPTAAWAVLQARTTGEVRLGWGECPPAPARRAGERIDVGPAPPRPGAAERLERLGARPIDRRVVLPAGCHRLWAVGEPEDETVPMVVQMTVRAHGERIGEDGRRAGEAEVVICLAARTAVDVEPRVVEGRGEARLGVQQVPARAPRAVLRAGSRVWSSLPVEGGCARWVAERLDGEGEVEIAARDEIGRAEHARGARPRVAVCGRAEILVRPARRTEVRVSREP